MGLAFSARTAPKGMTPDIPTTMPIELTHTLTFRLGSELYEQIERAAELNHLTLSEVIRQRLDGLEIRPRRRVVADEQLLRQLVRIGSNLNQQTRALHQMSHRQLPPNTQALIEAVQATQQLLQQVSQRVEEICR